MTNKLASKLPRAVRTYVAACVEKSVVCGIWCLLRPGWGQWRLEEEANGCVLRCLARRPVASHLHAACF